MKTLLVTAGGTWEPVDSVRVLGNRSTGATGIAIAKLASDSGWKVTLLLSEYSFESGPWPFEVIRFGTHQNLFAQMKERIGPDGPTAVIHCAAVADYAIEGIYQEKENQVLIPVESNENTKGNKIPSGLGNVWLKLTPLQKILGQIRQPWKYQGILISFKLEEGADLLARARENLNSSGSDLVVANTWSNHLKEALLVYQDKANVHGMEPLGARKAEPVIPIFREELPGRLVNFLEYSLGNRPSF